MGPEHRKRRTHHAKKHEKIELIRNDPDVVIYFMNAAVVKNKNATIVFHLLNKGTWAYPTSPNISQNAGAQAILDAIEHAGRNAQKEKKRISIFYTYRRSSAHARYTERQARQ